MRTWITKFRGIFSRSGDEHEFDQELQSHLDMLTEENLRRGMSRDDASAAARRSLGALARIKEENHEGRGFPLLEGFFKDLRYAWRMLWKNPGFTLIAVITLALGIGLNTTVFTAFNAVALKPLPVRDPYGVVRLEKWFDSGRHGDIQYAFSYPEYLYFARNSHALQGLVATSWNNFVPATLPDGSIEPLRARLVSANFFDELGVRPFLGRAFRPEEGREPGSNPVAVLSYRFWQNRFQSDPGALGAYLKIDNISFSIVGIAPEDFIGTGVPANTPDFWTPLMMQAVVAPGQNWLDDSHAYSVQILARPRPAVSSRQVQAEALLLSNQFAEAHPTSARAANPQKVISITADVAHFMGNTEDPRFKMVVGLVMFIVAMVLFIACANLANMLLARSSARQQELSVRLALGAGRGRLIRQLLIESSMLATLGGLAGFLLSIWSTKLLWIAIQQYLRGPFSPGSAFIASLSPDWRVLFYTLALSLATGILFGLSPALKFSRPDLTSALKDEGTAFGQRLGRSRLRAFLVAGQVAVSLMLLIVAGLLARGLARSLAVDPGYDARSIFMVNADYSGDLAKGLDLQRRIVDKLRELPQTAAVSLTQNVPMAGTQTRPLQTQDTRLKNFSDFTLITTVPPEYFATLDLPLRSGRIFSPAEAARSARVAVISEQTARRIWPDENPLGRRFKLQQLTGRTFTGWNEYEVIGVVKSVRSVTLSRVDALMVYVPLAPGTIEPILLRAQGDRTGLARAVRAAVESVDKNAAASLLFISLEDGPVRFERVQANLWAMSALSLAALALALASVGIYGVMSFLVTLRTREIGILMALGANRARVLRSILLQGLRPVLIGSVLGLAGASAITSLVHALDVYAPGAEDPLFGVSTFDPVTFLGLSALLAVIAMLASAVPAWRALRVDPMIALRYE